MNYKVIKVVVIENFVDIKIMYSDTLVVNIF